MRAEEIAQAFVCPTRMEALMNATRHNQLTLSPRLTKAAADWTRARSDRPTSAGRTTTTLARVGTWLRPVSGVKMHPLLGVIWKNFFCHEPPSFEEKCAAWKMEKKVPSAKSRWNKISFRGIASIRCFLNPIFWYGRRFGEKRRTTKAFFNAFGL